MLSDLYKEECKAQGAKANSKVVTDLKANPNDSTPEEMTTWDLTNTLVGTRGAKAVMAVVSKYLPKLETINLAGSNLTSPITKVILDAAVDHPTLHTINLADNDIRLGGPELIELVKRNRRIININVANTHLRNLFVRLLDIQLKKNSQSSAPAAAATTEENGATEEADPFVVENRIEAGDDDGEQAGGWGQARFSFGDASPDNDAAQQEEDDAAFANFKKVAFNNAEDAETGEKKPSAPRRPTVCSEVYQQEEIDAFEAPSHPKTEEEATWLLARLEKHDLFSHLEDYELTVAVAAMAEVVRQKDDHLYDAGDEAGDTFYVIMNGSVNIISGKEGEEETVVKTLTRGDTTMDLALLYPVPATDSAVIMENDTKIYTLDRQTYRIILSRASKKKREMYEGFLTTVPFLKEANLSKNELLQLADSLKSVTFEEGQTLIEYGEVGEAFYIIVEGVVDVYGRDDNDKVVKVCDFTVGENVGELEFLRNHRCVADVKARGHVRTAKMNRLHFEMVMGPVMDVLARTAGESNVYSYYRHQLEKMEKGHTPEPGNRASDDEAEEKKVDEAEEKKADEAEEKKADE